MATTVTINPGSAALSALGETARFTAEVRDQNGQVMAEAAVAWASSDASIATVDASGVATAAGNGSATITATSGSVSGTAAVTVTLAQVVNEADRAALVALYESTDGPNWIDNTNWLTDAPLGEWYGVETDESGRVVELDLSGRWDRETRAETRHGLTGPIPPELGNLSNLQRLTLYWNRLSGPIPPELGQLDNLRSLSLSQNRLQGRIPPELGSPGELQHLSLDSNLLTGPVPPELGNLTELRQLQIYRNNLSGPIPPELGGLANLRTLELYENGLSGPIPPNWAISWPCEHWTSTVTGFPVRFRPNSGNSPS